MTRPSATILQIIPDLDTGGAERTVLEISEAVVRAGGASIAVSRGGRMVAELEAAGATHVTLASAGTKNPIGIWSNARKLADLIGRQGVDLVHAHSRAPAWGALFAARRTRVPFVTTYHGAYNESGPLKRAYNSVMARGDVVIANSRYTARLVHERYGTPDDKMPIVYCGIDSSAFNPEGVSAARIAAVRQRWGLAPSHRAILLGGRLTGWKGQAVLIAAAAKLKDEGRLPDDVRIVLAGASQGRTSYVAELEDQIAGAGLHDRVLMVGHEADMPAAFLAATICIVASTEPETFGRSAAEAQAMGCPVIATRLGATPEVVIGEEPEQAPGQEPVLGRDAFTGWLVPPGDSAALADRIGQVLSLDSEALRSIGQRGRQHVMDCFGLTHVQRQTLTIYDCLLGTGLASAFDAAPRTENRARHA